jgi:hypothetical protein
VKERENDGDCQTDCGQIIEDGRESAGKSFMQILCTHRQRRFIPEFVFVWVENYGWPNFRRRRHGRFDGNGRIVGREEIKFPTENEDSHASAIYWFITIRATSIQTHPILTIFIVIVGRRTGSHVRIQLNRMTFLLLRILNYVKSNTY